MASASRSLEHGLVRREGVGDESSSAIDDEGVKPSARGSPHRALQEARVSERASWPAGREGVAAAHLDRTWDGGWTVFHLPSTPWSFQPSDRAPAAQI